MAGLFKRISNYVFGEGEELKFKSLINKIEDYECSHTRLHCIEPNSGTKMTLYSKARATLWYNDSNGNFYVSLYNLGEKDEDEIPEVLLPLFKGIKWNLDEPQDDEDNFKVKHYFDFTHEKDLKNVGGGRYQVDFNLDAKTNEVENFEDYINDILDFVESHPQEETKENPNAQDEEEEKKEYEGSLFEGEGTFFQYNQDEDRNDVVEENVKFLIQHLGEDYQYSFTVVTQDTGDVLIQTKIHGGSQVSIKIESSVLMWIHDTLLSPDDDAEAYVFYFTNKSEKDIEALSTAVSKCIFECQRQVSYEENVKEEDMDWMADAYVEDLKEDDEQSEYNEEDEEYGDIEDEYKDLLMDEEQEFDNKDIIQAHTYDRAFVVRGDGFGVYGTDEENGLNFCGDIPILNEYSDLPAENLMLHENENKLLFIDPQQRNQIKCFDFEKEKVVEEWEASGVKKFNSFFGESKNAQSTPSNNVIACSDKGLYTLDPRINNTEKNVSQKVYSSNYLFNRISANISGNIAVGSKNGEIRMYTKMGQNAKTMLPGMGQDIIHLDVSQNGAWILATCSNYILLIPTKTKDGRTGFEKRMGKEKQIPRKLKLCQSDVIKHSLKDKCFTKATFNNGGNISESFITASIGKFVVIWRLKKVAKGNLSDYDIKELHNSVVASESKFNTENEILVAWPRSLTVETRSRRK